MHVSVSWFSAHCNSLAHTLGWLEITVRPVSSLHLSDPFDSNSVAGSLTHLSWLEDNELPLDDQILPDISLLAVTADFSKFPSLPFPRDSSNLAHSTLAEKGPPCSTLRAWSLSKQPYTFSDAFSSLECKKLDIVAGETEWVSPMYLISPLSMY